MFKKSEEVDHIVSRMPTRFGRQLTIIVVFTVTMFLILSWAIQYPDVNRGTVTINTHSPAIKLVSNVSGRLKICKKNHEQVLQGDILGYIETATVIEDFVKIDSQLSVHQVLNLDYRTLLKSLPSDVHLGILSEKYFSLIDALQQYANYYEHDLFGKQINNLQNLQKEQNRLLESSVRQSIIVDSNLMIMNSFRRRDSILFSQNVLSLGDFDKNKLNLLSSSLNFEHAKSAVTSSKIEMHLTGSTLQETLIKKEQVEKELNILVRSSLQNLEASLKTFEEAYIFRSPINGTIQYLKFWNNDSYVNANELIFSIVPANSSIIGQVSVANYAAGKIRIGQEVLIKLDNYPYEEYGLIKGKVKDISLITITQELKEGVTEQYMVDVELPLGLQTDRGLTLDFKYELKGTAEIITQDKRLFERFFDNIRYLKKK